MIWDESNVLSGNASLPEAKESKDSKESKGETPSFENPQLESMTDEDLGSLMQLCGMKPNNSRQFMIRRLHDIVDFLHDGTAWLHSIREAPTPNKATKKGRNPKKGQADTSKKATETSPKAKSKPKVASPKVSPTAPDSLSPDVKYEKKLDLVADAIRKDKDLYSKLLTYVPLEIREVKRRIVEIAPELRSLGEQRLRKYLEEQGFASVS